MRISDRSSDVCSSDLQPSAAPTPPPPPEVTAMTVAPRTVALERTYPARAQAADDVEVRAQVEGILLERNYEEGGLVKAGAVLFQIDPAPYEARVQQAEAELDRARAQMREMQRQWKRASPPSEKKEIGRESVGKECGSTGRSRGAPNP